MWWRFGSGWSQVGWLWRVDMPAFAIFDGPTAVGGSSDGNGTNSIINAPRLVGWDYVGCSVAWRRP